MKTLEVLDADEVQRIHAASLRILERVGVELPHEEMRKRFASAGARVGGPDQRVRIPPALVADCLRQAGKEFVVRGRDPGALGGFRPRAAKLQCHRRRSPLELTTRPASGATATLEERSVPPRASATAWTG